MLSLVMLCCMAGSVRVYASSSDSIRTTNQSDSLLSIHDTIADSACRNVHLKYNYHTQRRNLILFFIPTMYTIAKGDRDYSGETFGKIRFSDDGEDNFGFLRRGSRGISPYEIEQLVVSGNARNHKRTMPRLLKFIMPNLYGETVFDNEILSPFHPSNRRFYTFDTTSNDSLTVRVGFSPKINNTQLISGYAIKDINTDRILRTVFSGDGDMLRYDVDEHMQDSTAD